MGFTVEMIDVLVFALGPFGGVGQIRENQPLQALRLASGIKDVLSLLEFMLVRPHILSLSRLGRLLQLGTHVQRPEIRDAEHGRGSLECGHETGSVVEIGLDDLDALFLQLLRRRARGVPADASDFPARLVQEGVDDRAALIPSGSDHDDKLGRHVWWKK